MCWCAVKKLLTHVTQLKVSKHWRLYSKLTILKWCWYLASWYDVASLVLEVLFELQQLYISAVFCVCYLSFLFCLLFFIESAEHLGLSIKRPVLRHVCSAVVRWIGRRNCRVICWWKDSCRTCDSPYLLMTSSTAKCPTPTTSPPWSSDSTPSTTL